MISCKLRQCGLGSQLFQIATTLALAWDNNDEACFDFSSQLQPTQGKRAVEYVDSIYRNLRIEQNPRVDVYLNESEHKLYQPFTQLNGLFLSQEHFIHHRDRLIDLFAPSKTMFIDLIFERAGLVQGFDSCAIHIRRGDYLEYSRYHPPLPIDYYLAAVEMFVDKTRFLVFSDDIEWCKNQLVGEKYKFIENSDDVHDLYLMSMCSHQIIANSTFSWWGSWLNQNKHKLVVAPKQWFGSDFSNVNAADIYTENMIVI